jgi:Zinc finger, C3HC4 type (RING finger)
VPNELLDLEEAPSAAQTQERDEHDTPEFAADVDCNNMDTDEPETLEVESINPDNCSGTTLSVNHQAESVDQEDQPQTPLKRLCTDNRGVLVAKRAKDIDAARNTAEPYVTAREEFARASDLRRAAEEFRKECEQAKEEAGRLLSCTKADRRLAQEELKTATEKRRQVDEQRISAEVNHREVEKRLKEAEEDRRQAAELRKSAFIIQRLVGELQQLANEDERQAATLLSTAAEEKQRILEEIPEEAKQDRQKARVLLAECKALWERTAAEMEPASVVCQQGEDSGRSVEASHGQEVAQQLPIDAAGEQSSNNTQHQPHEQNPAPPRPREVVIDVDLEFEELERQIYSNQTLLFMVPDVAGVQRPFIEEYQVNGPYLNVELPDPAQTAPHGTMPPGPTFCTTCSEHIATCVMVPCGHMVICGPCASELQKTTNRCPACEQGASGEVNKQFGVKVF